LCASVVAGAAGRGRRAVFLRRDDFELNFVDRLSLSDLPLYDFFWLYDDASAPVKPLRDRNRDTFKAGHGIAHYVSEFHFA
jgi:hypothetical protein